MPGEQTPPQNDSKPTRRRWFQFSLRTMIIVTAIFCILLATWIIPSERQRRAAELISKHGGSYRFFGEKFQTESDWRKIEFMVPTQKPGYSHYFHNVEEIFAPTFHNIQLGEFPHLKKLSIGLYKLTAKQNSDENLFFLRPLAENGQITDLDLGMLHISGNEMNELCKLKNLEQLHVRHPTSVQELSSLQKLKGLSTNLSRVPPGDLEHLQKFPQLEMLKISIQPRQIPEIEFLKKIPTLKQLSLYVEDPTYSNFARYQDDALEKLQECTQLESLNVVGTHTSDRGLSYIASLVNLRELNLNQTKITNDGLHHLTKLKKLERLEIETCDSILHPNFDDLAKLTTLKHLNIRNTIHANDKELEKLLALSELEELGLDISDAALDRLMILSEIKKLKRIYFVNSLGPVEYPRKSLLSKIEEVQADQNKKPSTIPPKAFQFFLKSGR